MARLRDPLTIPRFLLVTVCGCCVCSVPELPPKEWKRGVALTITWCWQRSRRSRGARHVEHLIVEGLGEAVGFHGHRLRFVPRLAVFLAVRRSRKWCVTWVGKVRVINLLIQLIRVEVGNIKFTHFRARGWGNYVIVSLEKWRNRSTRTTWVAEKKDFTATFELDSRCTVKTTTAPVTFHARRSKSTGFDGS